MPEANYQKTVEAVAERLKAFAGERAESGDALRGKCKEALEAVLRALAPVPARRIPELVTRALELAPQKTVLREAVLERYEKSANGFFAAQRAQLETMALELRKVTEELHGQYLAARLEAIAELWREVAHPLVANGYPETIAQTAAFADRLKSLCIRIQNEGLPGALLLNRMRQRIVEEIRPEKENQPEAAEETLRVPGLHRTGTESLPSLRMVHGLGKGNARKLLMMEDAFAWDNAVYRMEDIAGLTWNSEIQYGNGQPYAVHYQIRIQTSQGNEAEITPETALEYNALVGLLWKTAGMRLLADWQERLRKGETLRVGNMEFDAKGAMLTQYGWLNKVPRRFSWKDIALESRPSGFVLQGGGDFTAVFSYETTYQSRLLEHLYQQFQDK